MSEEVLLLDDDATMLGVLNGILSGAGYNCVAAADAFEALALVASRPAIAVVISDILMPGMTGLQFVQRLNGLALERPRPRVLLLTAQPTLEAAVDALRLGVRDFLVKPLRAAELVEAVGRAMGQARADRAARQAAPEVELLLRQAEELVNRLRGIAHAAEAGGQGVAAMASAMATVTDATGAPRAPPVAVPQGPATSGRLGILDTIEQLRRLRARYVNEDLDDTGWDLLLELLRAERMRQKLSVSGLAISINSVSTTTALRRINELAASGHLERAPDPGDARRDFVSLTAKSRELLSGYLEQANTYLSAMMATAPPDVRIHPH